MADDGMVEIFSGPALEAQVLRTVLDGAGLAATMEEGNDTPPTARLFVPAEYAEKALSIIDHAQKGFGGPLDATMRD